MICGFSNLTDWCDKSESAWSLSKDSLGALLCLAEPSSSSSSTTTTTTTTTSNNDNNDNDNNDDDK